MVAYAPTEEVPEGQKAKHMAALNSTVVSVPALECVFVLTDTNARTGKRGKEREGEADSKVLGAYGRYALNENGKLLLGFVEHNKLALLNTFFFGTPKTGVSYIFQSANRSKDYILTKQEDRRLIRCVIVRLLPLEAPESDHNNLVYTKVRIPRRSTTNVRKRGSPKETLKTADPRRLMADPNLRCQVAIAMVAALPPILDSTCIIDIATDMVDVMFSTAA